MLPGLFGAYFLAYPLEQMLRLWTVAEIKNQHHESIDSNPLICYNLGNHDEEDNRKLVSCLGDASSFFISASSLIYSAYH